MLDVVFFRKFIILSPTVVVPLQGCPLVHVGRATDVVPLHEGLQHLNENEILTATGTLVASLVHIGIEGTPELVDQVGTDGIGRSVTELPVGIGRHHLSVPHRFTRNADANILTAIVITGNRQSG